jgi:small subunit ribosomal protein S1
VQLDVVVVKIGKDAVFVDLDGKQEGFLELDSLTGEDGQPIVQVGSRITARIVEVGGKQGAARLEPVRVRSSSGAETAIATDTGPVLTVGGRVKGTVTGVERYGVFLKLGPRQRGLVPVSELGAPRGADLRKLYATGQELEAKIVAIDEQGRIRLSVTQLASDEERREFESFSKNEPGEKGEKKEARPQRGFGTLGDLLGKVQVAPKPATAAKTSKAAPAGSPAPKKR